jgi:hypothetical protein
VTNPDCHAISEGKKRESGTGMGRGSTARHSTARQGTEEYKGRKIDNYGMEVWYHSRQKKSKSGSMLHPKAGISNASQNIKMRRR